MIYTTSIKNYQRNFARSKTSRIRSAVVSLCLLCSLYSKASVVQKSFHQSSHINSNRTTLVISFVIWFTIHSLALTLHSYSQTEIKLVLDFNIQFPALSLTTDSVRPLFWRVCQLFPGRKQTTCAPTIRACVHMITAREISLLRIEVGVKLRLSPRTFFDSNTGCRTFCDIIMIISSIQVMQYFVCWRRIFTQFQDEEEKISVGNQQTKHMWKTKFKRWIHSLLCWSVARSCFSTANLSNCKKTSQRKITPYPTMWEI